MRPFQVGLAFVFLTTSCAAGPVWSTVAPEKMFTYRGAPIHPGCLDSGETKEGDTIDLKTCTAEAKKTYHRPTVKNGSVNADGIDETSPHPVFASYSVLANNGSQFLLQTQWSGGGTGIFDGLSIVERQGDSLRLKKFITGGDRCVGGLASARVKGDKLLYSSDIPPYYMIAEPTEALTGAYQNLNFGAISCVARNDMEWDLSAGKERRLSLTLTGEWYTGNGAPGKPLEVQPGSPGEAINACFNRLYNSYFLRKQTHLDPAALAAFRQKFFASCKK